MLVYSRVHPKVLPNTETFLHSRVFFVTCVVPALCQIMYSLSVCSDGTTSAAPRSFRQNRPPARTLSLTERGAGLDDEALFKEPRPVVYMQRCLHEDPDMPKVHVHVHSVCSAENLLVAQQHQGVPRQGPWQGVDACASLCIATARLCACHGCLLY